jgi:hypothetical protein
MDSEWLRAQLPERHVEWHNTIGSTMTEASLPDGAALFDARTASLINERDTRFEVWLVR